MEILPTCPTFCGIVKKITSPMHMSFVPISNKCDRSRLNSEHSMGARAVCVDTLEFKFASVCRFYFVAHHGCGRHQCFFVRKSNLIKMHS